MLREIARVSTVASVWILTMWLGWNAVDEPMTGLLLLYVFLASTGVAGFVGWLLWDKRLSRPP
jgi:hypothetical protein